MVDTRPSILFINRVYPPEKGATGRMLRDLARSFARRGWQVHVLATGPKAIRELDGAVKITRIKAPEKPGMVVGYPLVWLKLLVALLRMPKADIVVSMTDPPLAVGLGTFAAKRMKAKHIHWCQDLYPDVLPALGVHFPDFIMNVLGKLSVRWMKRADKVIVIGRCMGRRLLSKGIGNKKVSVIPNWPDFELTEEAVSARLNDSPKPSFDHVDSAKPYEEQLKAGQKFRVLYAGNIGLAHPMNTIMDAAKVLNETNPEVEFVFVGQGQRFDKIAQYRAEFGLENIRLLPYQPNSRLREVMESGDIHLISMRSDAVGCIVPSKIYAAIAVGRPTVFVGPPRTELCKILRDFKAGLQVREGDTQALVESILYYRNSGDEWFAGHEGAKAAAEVFVPSDSMEVWHARAARLIGRDESDMSDTPGHQEEADYARAA